MTTITKYIVLTVLCLILSSLQAQEIKTDTTKVNLAYRTNGFKIDQLVQLKKTVKTEEREFLKEEVESINQRLDNNGISKDQADMLKKQAAEKRAQNIENRLAIIDNKIALLERNDQDYAINDSDNNSFKLTIGDNDKEYSLFSFKNKNKPKRYDRRTTSEFVAAIGFNNAFVDGESIGDSYSVLGSGFVELGFSWKTRILENTNALRFKYGLSFQWNKFTPKDDKFFVQEENTTTLETFPDNLIESEFRITNLVLPIFIEFGPSRKIERDNYFRYSTTRQFKVGLGAYGGLRIGTQQKLRYKEDGDRVKQKIRRNYNASDFIYGLGAYVGIGQASLYVKYDLNTVFDNQVLDQNNISMGIRFDFD